MTVCYICFEDGAQSSYCLCTDATVHAECLAVWVSQSRSKRCRICTSEFRNVTLERKETVSMTDDGRLACSFAFASVFCLSYATWIFYCQSRNVISYSAMTLLGFSALEAWFTIGWLTRQRRLTQRKRRLVKLHVGQV